MKKRFILVLVLCFLLAACVDSNDAVGDKGKLSENTDITVIPNETNENEPDPDPIVDNEPDPDPIVDNEPDPDPVVDNEPDPDPSVDNEPTPEVKSWQTLLIESYLEKELLPLVPTAKIEDVTILNYYGTYGRSVVVMMDNIHFNYTDAERTEVIGGQTFLYNNGNDILVWNNDAFYELKEAYNQGMLTTEDLMQINYYQKGFYPFMYSTEFTYKAFEEVFSTSDYTANGLLRIESYADYQKYIQYIGYKHAYNEAYFQTHQLILYGWVEGSGSTNVSVDSVDLDHYGNLILTIERRVPEIGTADVKYHQILIEYEISEIPVVSVNVFFKSYNETMRQFKVHEGVSALEMKEFFESKKDRITYVSISAKYDESKKEAQESWNAFNQRMTTLYGLDLFGSSIYFGDSNSYVSIGMDDFSNLDLDLLVDCGTQEDIVQLYLTVYYIHVEFSKR